MRIEEIRQRLRALGAGPRHEAHVLRRWAQALPQDSGKLGAQSRGYGWSEMAGAITLFSREAFKGLSAAEFKAELALFAP